MVENFDRNDDAALAETLEILTAWHVLQGDGPVDLLDVLHGNSGRLPH